MSNLISFDQRHASPSYKSAGKGQPKCRKELLPIKEIVCIKCNKGGGTLKMGKMGYEHVICGVKEQPNREQRREDKREALYRKCYMDSLGNKHRQRLAKVGITQ